MLSSLLTEEHAAGEARNAGAQRHVVITEVATVWIELADVDVELTAAAVHGVDRPTVQLVALQLTRLVVLDLVARQQPVTEKTNTARPQQHACSRPQIIIRRTLETANTAAFISK